MASPTGPDCMPLEDDLAALSLGALTGHDRARVLAHLEGCPTCSATLEELSATADALVDLIPEATPPEGFSERTMAMIRGEQAVSRGPVFRSPVSRSPGARSPVIRRLAAAAAVVVTLALGAGIGDVVASSSRSAAAAVVRTAPLHSTLGTEGTVVLVSSGQSGWLAMTLQDAPTSGMVTCSVTLADGSRRDVGRFSLTEGYGSWAAPMPVSATAVRSVSLIDGSGTTVAAAQVR
jgi:anti-sigma factor RsiW